MPTESKFLSNVVYNQPFDPRDDITVSFLYSSPSIDNGDNLLLEGEEFDQALFELQNSGDFLVLNSGEASFNGLGVFLIDGSINTLTGGGAGSTDVTLSSYDPGIGMVTDTTTTASSAISGFIAAIALDQSGAFGKQNSLEQFTTGTAELSSGNIVARTFNSETSTFPFKGSETPSAPTVVEESFNIFRVGFKRRLQDIVFYKKEGNIYEPDVSFTTDIALSAIPESVKIGFTYSGTKPTDLKNIAVNGARFRDIHTVPIPVESSPAPAPEPSPVSAPEPTYNLSRNISNVNEGDSFTITLTTQGVDNGVTVPYTISGVEPADIDDAPLTGNFTINNNTATKTFNVTEDFTTEGNETFTLTLNGQSESISVILNDTSTPEDQSLSVLFIGNSRPFNVRSQDTDEIFSNTQYEEPGGHDTLNDKIDSDDYDIIVLNNVDWTNNGVFDPNQTTYEKLKGFVERGGVVFDSVEHSSYNNYNFNGNTGTTSGVVSNIAYDLGGIIGLNSGWKARSSILREDLYLSTEAQDNNIITILDTDVVDFAQVINNSRSRGYPLLNIDSADGATSVLHMWDGGVPGQLNSGIDGKIIMLGESIDIYLSDYFITSLLGYIARTKV